MKIRLTGLPQEAGTEADGRRKVFDGSSLSEPSRTAVSQEKPASMW